MGSPTARASTPSVSVGARIWLALGWEAVPEEWQTKGGSWENSEILLAPRCRRSASFDKKDA